MFSGRRQPSSGGTSRMMREYHVRICERLGVKFPGPTRHGLPLRRHSQHARCTLESGRLSCVAAVDSPGPILTVGDDASRGL
jgi:hypothetical protein